MSAAGCQVQSDITFLIDTSIVGQQDAVVGFIKSIIGRIFIDNSGGASVGVVTFGFSPNVLVHLGTRSDKAVIYGELDRLPFRRELWSCESPPDTFAVL